MIDIGDKDVVRREAVAEGFIKLNSDTVNSIRRGEVKKGNVVEVSKVSGVLGAKMTPQLIPHCHPIPIESVNPEIEVLHGGVRVICTVRARYRTGVEMEALSCVNSALLTIWDMVKYIEKDRNGQYATTEISGIRVLRKSKEKLERK